MVTYVDVPSLIIIIVVVIATGVILLLSQKKKNARVQQIQTFASQCGWTFEPIKERLVSGYRISKGEWVLESTRESTSSSDIQTGSSGIQRKTVWWSKAATLPSGIVLVGPRSPVPDLGGIGDFVMQAALKIMIGADAEFTQGIKETELSRAAVNERFMLWTNQEEMAQRILSMDVENALINLPKTMKLVIKFTPLCLEVKVIDQCLDTPQEISAVIKVGEALWDAAR